jgi:Polyketide cyclase / dehydrase and lipid transport
VTVDVETSIEIGVARDQVAAFASNPENAPRWYVNIRSVVLETPPPVTVGSRMAFVAHFLGRRIAYTYEVRELVEAERFVMGTADGPFPMQTTYTWSDTADGGTRMTLRNQGEPSGFGHVTAHVMVRAMRRANRKDLSTLKDLLENTST